MGGPQPGEGKYARLEREQRWLLGALPPGRAEPRQIHDHYLVGTSFRLRRIDDGTQSSMKLTQKVRTAPDDPEFVQITTAYLTAAEYDVFASLEANELKKTRWTWGWQGRRLSVDEFGGRLSGLVLAELELARRESRLPSPPGSIEEVTDDDLFSGASLAAATADHLDSIRRRQRLDR